VTKRLIDLVLAAAVLIVTVPVLLIAAVAIKLQDRGSVLYTQERIGKDGRRFRIYKLRTMVPDAEHLQAQLVGVNGREGPLFKASRDPRVTRLGRLLRLMSLDELPQLINVLKGEMSLVGPRPALPSEVERFDDDLLRRLTAPPGISGLWQVKAREDPSFDSYRRLDLQYVDNWSVRLDLTIIVLTVLVVLGRPVKRAVRSLPDTGEPSAPAAAILD
jgi:lipopolysaccharide/colanic/teichoic acid biosynthesis glycosyltransferase